LKRYIIFICAVFSCAILCSFSLCCYFLSPKGEVNNVVLDYGTSVKFSEAEIDAAMKVAIGKARGYEDCELTKLWYDEEESDAKIEDVLSYSQYSDIEEGNVIILFAELKTGNKPGGFPKNTIVEGWGWILVRENKTAEWKTDDGVWLIY